MNFFINIILVIMCKLIVLSNRLKFSINFTNQQQVLKFLHVVKFDRKILL